MVAGTHVARDLYPGGGRLAVADAHTKALAKDALRGLSAGGGTAIGTWLRLADRLLGPADAGIRHGVLLTDGRDETRRPRTCGRRWSPARAGSPATPAGWGPTGR
ncbi:hypothetical protein SCALM49S_02173 [Streptomyces californicus]